MKCTIPEISWHNRDPVLSVDIQPRKDDHNSPCRLATGGTDTHVVVWYLTVKESGLASVEVVADLQRHQKAVNTVRFSPSGSFLASGDDESVIIVWKQKTDQDAPELPIGDSEANKEQWLTLKTLRGHLEDVYDLSWSSDSAFLISGSIDNTAILWDVQKGRNMGILSEHGGFVQGVAWDPKSQYIATLSSDRICRVYNVSTKKIVCKVSKATLPVPEGSELDGKVVRLFHDDTLKSFFRRLAFSPDGELLVTPAGIVEIPNSETHFNATYIFARNDFSRPVVYLPSPNQYTVAVRFCPVLFKLRKGSSLFSLPYRMVLAIATQSNVLLYDTQQAEPFALISNIHYTRLTDLSWSSDGRTLIASSTDGYCSIITFSSGELGEVYKPSEEIPEDANNSESDKRSQKFIEKQNRALLNISGSSERSEKRESMEMSGSLSTIKSSLPVVGKSSESPKIKGLERISEDNQPQSGSVRKRKPVKRIIPIPVPKIVEKSSKETITESSKNTENSTPNCPVSYSKSSQLSKPIKRITPIPVSKIEVKAKIYNPNEKNDGLAVTAEYKNVLEEKMEIDKLPAEKTDGSKVTEKSAFEVDIPKPDLSAFKVDMPKPGIGESSALEVDLLKPEMSTIDMPKPDIQESSALEVDLPKPDLSAFEVDIPKPEIGETSALEVDIPQLEIGESSACVNKSAQAQELSPSRSKLISESETTPSKPQAKIALKGSGTGKKIHSASSNDLSTPLSSSPQVEVKSCNVTPIQNRTPRRVQLITLSSPKSKKKLL